MTVTGFGDRLRGVAHLLHLAHRHRDSDLRYNDDGPADRQTERWRAFPARMTDLVRLEGLSFEYQPDPMPAAEHEYVAESSVLDLHRARSGFPHMRNLHPRDDAVAERVRELGVDARCVGVHVRWTDNLDTEWARAHPHPARAVVGNLRRVTRWAHGRRVFLAADNKRSVRRWTRILERLGFEVVVNEAVYDPGALRQTGTFDMLVDFFALAACRRMVRILPSEFSRFAAWVGGRRLRYRDLL